MGAGVPTGRSPGGCGFRGWQGNEFDVIMMGGGRRRSYGRSVRRQRWGTEREKDIYE